ncbi:MAG TPA: methylated-DNA--[protein]-cysteine S-methyltransferase [Acidimicrobiales bacterium]|nr:methylated-DNA--[protein]-cysteine S-methyltransferase [Acidimicrobiales bacterium]
MRYARVAVRGADLVVAGHELVELVSFELHRGNDPVQSDWVRDDAAFVDAQRQLVEWFTGERLRFELERAPVGTRFQRRVWAALEAIPYGETRTYGDLAAELDTAPRAVGAANGANPFAVIVPCHRLVGRAGLTGYAGGIERKRWLLDFEAQTSSSRLMPASRSTNP